MKTNQMTLANFEARELRQDEAARAVCRREKARGDQEQLRVLSDAGTPAIGMLLLSGC